MQRPEFISNEDITRWSNDIDQDSKIPKEYKDAPIIREVMYSGIWLAEQLKKLNCPQSLITRIQWTAGRLSFGRDIWEVHQEIFDLYKNDGLSFEEDPNETKN